MACDDRQLTQAQREAAFQQQRTGVQRAVRPFSGSPTIKNLIDYINRELTPAVRSTRDAVNECFLQVADNAPSANPLAFYFSASTVNADPTVGRIRLNQAVQNTATVMRVSQSNARLIDVQPWLDVMAGGPTTPLGVVTLTDAINPGRFIRFDLNTMTDQGAYWDLGITVIESSTASPFVEDEAVVVGFISGVSAAGSTIPVGSLSPIARDTFVGNITTGTAPPTANLLADIDSTSIVYDATSHTFQRAALTGFAAATQNSNATTSAEPIVTYSASANMSAERVTTSSTSVTVSTSVANQIEFQRAAITGAVAVVANANTSLFAGIRDNGSAENDRTNLNFLSTASITALVTDDAANDELEITCTIPNAGVTNALLANINPGRVKGLQVDAAAAAAPVDLTGAEVGELIRFALLDDGAGAAGTTDDFALDVRTNIVRINPGSLGGDVIITGFALNGGGSTNNAGGRFDLVKQGLANRIILKHSTGSVGNNQNLLPYARDYILSAENEVASLGYWGGRWQVIGPVNAGRLLAVTKYVSGSGTHTYHAEARSAEVEIVGQGGGGGGVADAEEHGGGGAGGAYHRFYITTLPTSSAYNVGDSSGIGGSGATSADGTAGEDTTFVVDAETYRAQGGGGGTGGNDGTPGNGGIPTALTYTVLVARGKNGEWGEYANAGHVTTLGGAGGDGPWGGGGVSTEDAVGQNGSGPGAGGSGASSFGGTDRSGGSGDEGIIIIKEYS